MIGLTPHIDTARRMAVVWGVHAVVVPDVQAFPGHIACDADSRSEIVVPLIRRGTLLGVLDVDSPRPDRFDQNDARGLEAMVAQLLAASDFERLATS